jgi:hypothetical protein
MDPLTPQVAPVPESPLGAPGIPSASAPELSQEQMRTNLQDVQTKLQNSFQGFNKQTKVNELDKKAQDSEVLRALFDMLQAQGVDPNSPEDVKVFLDEMKVSNPERYQQIVQAISGILGGEDMAAAPGEVPPVEPAAPLATEGLPSDNMNINTNAQTSPNI